MGEKLGEKRHLKFQGSQRKHYFDSISKRYYANYLIRPDKNDLQRKGLESREGRTQAYLILLHFADTVFITS